MKQLLLIDIMHPVFHSRMEAAGLHVVDGTSFSREEILAHIGPCFGIVLRSRLLADRELIGKAVALKFIARAGAGMESIDLDYAAEKKIACFNSPEGNRDAVAEHALGMLLSLMHNLARSGAETKQGQWHREPNRGTELGGKTVGIIGFGNMGSAFAARLGSFGCRVLAYDKYKTGFSSAHVEEAGLEIIQAKADVISLHVPLTDETKYLVDEKFFDALENKIYLVNTARGQIVKTSALAEALRSGRVMGAALDVHEYEDHSFETNRIGASTEVPAPLRELLASDNVIITPHIAGWTHESKRKIAEVLAGKIEAFLKGNS